MKDIRTLHNEAMDLALEGDITTQKEPGGQKGIELYTLAFEKEREAALLAELKGNPEPGLSILFRSAASLAVQCGRYREAEQLVAKALSGNPPESIAKELREVLQDIYSQSGRADDDILMYNLEVPCKEKSRFESLLSQLGISVSQVRRVVGSVALL